MNKQNANTFVVDLLAGLRDTIDKEYAGEPETKLEVLAALDSIQQGLVLILQSLFDGQLDDAGRLAEEYAPLIGSLGGAGFLDPLADQRASKLASVRPSLMNAAAITYAVTGNLTEAKKRFLSARRLAFSQKQNDLAARIAVDIGRIEAQAGRINEAKKWYDKAVLEASGIEERLIEAKALNNSAMLDYENDLLRADDLLRRSLRLKEEFGASKESKIATLGNLGVVLAETGEHEEAFSVFKQVFSFYKSRNDKPNMALSLLNLANETAILGRFSHAEKRYQQGIDIARQINDIETERMLHQGFAVGAANIGRYETAATEFKALFDLMIGANQQFEAAVALHDLGLTTARTGRKDEAETIINEALESFVTLRDVDWQRRCLMVLALEIKEPSSDAGIKVLYSAVSLRGGQDKELRIATSFTLWQALVERNEYQEASKQLNRTVRFLKHDSVQLREFLHHAGQVLFGFERNKESLRRLRQAADIRPKGEEIVMAQINLDLALALVKNNRLEEACELLRQNYDLASRRQDRVLKANSIGNMGELERRRKNAVASIKHLEEAIELSRAINDLRQVAFWSNDLALAFLDLENFARANAILRSGLRIAQQVAAIKEEATLLATMGIVAARQEKYENARILYDSAIKAARLAKDFQQLLEARYNRSHSLYHLDRREEALTDIFAIINDSYERGLIELANEAAQSGAVWAIEWNRRIRAGQLTAISFLICFASEAPDPLMQAGLFVIANRELTRKAYQQFRRALREQLLKSDESGMAWRVIKKVEDEVIANLTKLDQTKF